MVYFKVILSLAMGLRFTTCAFAQENTTLQDRLIGATFKTLAKTYLAIADLEKIKKKNIDKLNKMEEKKFRKRYAEVYTAIKDLPVELKNDYKITANMTKEQAIDNIALLDKKKIYKIIEFIPDTAIADQFKQYLDGEKQNTKKINLAQQINELWNKITQSSSK